LPVLVAEDPTVPDSDVALHTTVTEEPHLRKQPVMAFCADFGEQANSDALMAGLAMRAAGSHETSHSAAPYRFAHRKRSKRSSPRDRHYKHQPISGLIRNGNILSRPLGYVSDNLIIFNKS
jgi:hypothetical protein